MSPDVVVLLTRGTARFDRWASLKSQAGALWLLVWLAHGACAVQRPAEQAAPSSARARDRALRPGAAADELYDAGLRFLRASDLTRAEQYFASAMRLGHSEETCLRALLVTTLRASRFRSALSYAQPQLASRPRDVPLRLLVAAIHLALGELVQAERELERALRVEEAHAEAHYLLALVRLARAAPAAELRPPLLRYLELAPRGSHAEEVQAALREPSAIERAGASRPQELGSEVRRRARGVLPIAP